MENKLGNVGALILNLPTQFQQPSMALSKLKQLNNALVDTSKLAIGRSGSLALSHWIAQGCHYIVTDKLRFQLQWSYKSQNVMLYCIPSMNASTLPHNWSCDFILKFDKENFQHLSRESISSTTGILAVICCGKSQCFKDDGSSSIKILVGSLKTTLLANTDVRLTLLLLEHKQMVITEPNVMNTFFVAFDCPLPFKRPRSQTA